MYYEDFDPFSPKTWNQEKVPITAEETAEIDKNIASISQQYKDSHDNRQLLHYLKFGKADLAFHRKLKRDKDFKQLVGWIKASDQRIERAIKELDHYISVIKCPHCNGEFKRGEEIELADYPFSWEEFAAGE